jgi:hypothetical protein
MKAETVAKAYGAAKKKGLTAKQASSMVASVQASAEKSASSVEQARILPARSRQRNPLSQPDSSGGEGPKPAQ